MIAHFKEILLSLLIFSVATECLSQREKRIIPPVTATFLDELYTLNELRDDRDGRKYVTIKIGNQEWMAENLKFLPTVHSSSDVSVQQPRYYIYKYAGRNVKEAELSNEYRHYGVLYNYPAAIADDETDDDDEAEAVSDKRRPKRETQRWQRGVCPAGWHLPTDEEWMTLETFLGMKKREASITGRRGEGIGSKIAGKKKLWDADVLTDNKDFNEFAFDAVPAGCLMKTNKGFVFAKQNKACFFWTASETAGGNYYRSLSSKTTTIFRQGISKAYGFSVRCVKDR